jgi:hypothetical protein
VAYVALPLVLHILDVKLATSELQRVRKQGRLKIYTKAMKVLQSQYDGPDELSEIIATMINYVSLEHSMQRPKLNSTDESELSQPRGGHLRAASISTLAMPTGALSAVNDWGGVLLRQPDLYLHFTLTIDLALEKGHFPDHRDFPVALQSRSATTTRFPMYRITMGNMNRIDDSHAHAEKSGRNDQNAGTAKDAPNNEHGINTDVIPTSPTGTLPTTDGFINQMQPVSIDSGNNLNDDLDLPMDFGSFAMAGPDEGDIEFSCASPWLDEMFFTTV